ncbi:hypothetical protein HWV01_10550 [Moritella sp. 5]|uniref:hypothetical protein n=1 Tax=Moritella sp. 5 TaxID=2746231 RepID=UPI001BA7C467|nr:hypothetical protein [Moritella sp. 5]QUM80687.1 hypothetical protein HWV01_10550 [Moritella sp. 5]
MAQQYFSIQHSLSVNIEPVSIDQVPTSRLALENEMPVPFKMANDVAEIDSNALRSIRNIGEQADALADFLQMQNNKINLIMGYVLAQQDHPESRFNSTMFGAGEVKFLAHTDLALEQAVRIKIFLPNDSSAIYCYGAISEREEQHSARDELDTDDSLIEYTASYTRIRDIDREILIRATLRIQQLQLKQRAELRQENGQ